MMPQVSKPETSTSLASAIGCSHAQLRQAKALRQMVFNPPSSTINKLPARIDASNGKVWGRSRLRWVPKWLVTVASQSPKSLIGSDGRQPGPFCQPLGGRAAKDSASDV